MAERSAIAQWWVGRAVFALIALMLIFVRLLPLDTVPRGWAPPDLLLAVTVAWAIRRPDFVPILLVAAIHLTADLLFQRPPGLGAAIVVVAAEMLRNRAAGFRTVPFLVEWLAAALAIAGIALAQRIALALAVSPQAPLLLTLSETGLTILAYPAVIAAAHVLFGITRRAPGEVDGLGNRL